MIKRALASFSIPWPSSRRSFEQFLQRKYTQPGQTRLIRERIFILPTYYGVVFAAMLLVMLLGSLNYNNNLAFALTFLLGAMALISTYHTYRNINQLVVRAGRSPPTFCGQPATLILQVDNHGLAARYAVTLRWSRQVRNTVDIPENASTQVTLSIPTETRGRMMVPVVTVETRFPLGMYRAWSYAGLNSSVVVYPKPIAGILPLPPVPDSGNQRGVQPVGTDDFTGFRAYHAGDSPRHVYWKAVARGQPLLTKKFSRPEAQRLWLDWTMAPGPDTETRLSQLCRWVLDADRAHLHYGLRLPGVLIAPDVGEPHRHRCLEALALYKDGQ